MAQERRENLFTKCHEVFEAQVEDPGPSHLLSGA